MKSLFAAGAVVLLIFFFLALNALRSKGRNKPDPMDEAEVFLAYGRKKQAIALLEKALQADQGRDDIRQKLKMLKVDDD